MIMYQANNSVYRMYSVVFEWISQFAACRKSKYHNPSKRRESFRKKAEVRLTIRLYYTILYYYITYRADIILSIECILSFSNGFYNSQRIENILIRFFIIYLNNENLFDWNKTEKERYNYVPGEYNSVHRIYSVVFE